MRNSPLRAFASPAKHTKEESGFEHPHPHTKQEKKAAEQRKMLDAREVREGRTSSVVPSEMKELEKEGTKWEKRVRKY